MYHYLHGKLAEASPGRVVLEVNGIGFDVVVPASTDNLPRRGEPLTLWTHLHFKEDGFQLFGFLQRTERDLFRLLLRVPGVGPRLAMQILSGIEPEELVQVMAAEDWKRLTLIPGIGPKTARRLLIELKERLTSQELQFIPSGAVPALPVMSQAFAALTNLGFAPEAVRVALKEAAPNHEPQPNDLEEIVKKALSLLAT